MGGDRSRRRGAVPRQVVGPLLLPRVLGPLLLPRVLGPLLLPRVLGPLVFPRILDRIALDEPSFALDEPSLALGESPFALDEPPFALDEPPFALDEPPFALDESSVTFDQPPVCEPRCFTVGGALFALGEPWLVALRRTFNPLDFTSRSVAGCVPVDAWPDGRLPFRLAHDDEPAAPA